MKNITTTCMIAVTSLLSCVAFAEDEFEPRSPWRGEIGIGLQSWSGLSELNAADGGEFETLGFHLSAAAHYSVKTFEDSELMIGGDLGFMSNSSDIALYTDDLTARAMYVGPSMKWFFGREHDFSLDVGLMYWDIDFAEVNTEYGWYFEREVWREDGVGGFVGATWDVGAGNPMKTSGLMFNAKVHFVDFGDVKGDDTWLLQTLGPTPGELEGPIYQAQIGYRWR